MQRATLYLMVGYPGAGKTTVSQVIQRRTGAVHLWTDRERHAMFGGVYQEADSDQLYTVLSQRTADLLKAGTSVIYDTNFNYRKDRNCLRELAAAAGADTKLVWLTTDKALSYARAVTNPNGKPTRVYTDMSAEDFERIASRLETPTADEQPVRLDGTNLAETDIIAALKLPRQTDAGR